jgi:hypothetical protein
LGKVAVRDFDDAVVTIRVRLPNLDVGWWAIKRKATCRFEEAIKKERGRKIVEFSP